MRYTVVYFDNMSAGRPEYDYCSFHPWFLEGGYVKNRSVYKLSQYVHRIVFKSSAGFLMSWGAIAIPETHPLFNAKLPMMLVDSLDKGLSFNVTRVLEEELLDICYEVLTERRESLHSDEEND